MFSQDFVLKQPETASDNMDITIEASNSICKNKN